MKRAEEKRIEEQQRSRERGTGGCKKVRSDITDKSRNGNGENVCLLERAKRNGT